MFRRISILLITALVGQIGMGPLFAQQQTGSSRAPTRVPVTIALVDQLPQADAPFMVQRRPDVAPHDVILLRSTADAKQLSEAIHALLVIRQAGGDTATSRATMRMRPQQPQQGARPEFPWVPRVMADLRRAEPKQIAGVGTVRAVEIWLPPQHRRGARR
ncbi:MAG: hypothetical protein M3418_04560 [Gemmatimonadota bacterium]|nr:hypothetical protein [Gemmatimonadota bacterium]